MRWEAGHKSGNVIDRRGAPSYGSGRGVRVGVPMGLGGLLVLGVLSLLFGRDLLSPAVDGYEGGPSPQAAPIAPQSDPDAELVQFVSFVLDDAQASWRADFERRGQPWRDARLVLFTQATSTGCGDADADIGPFYCPNDEQLYIDLSFYRELRSRFGAPGDFAQAYVLAHEVGHHVQHQLGIDARVRDEEQRDPSRASALSVRLELQADCYAGVWARSTARRQLLEPGDMDEAMRAATAVGDDTLERSAGQIVRPDSFTHGSAAQRTYWLHQGYQSGSLDACDTFRDGS